MKDLEEWCNRFAVVFLILFAAYFFWMIFLRPSHLPDIREITSAQRKIADAIDQKFKLKAYPRLIDLTTGEISFYKHVGWVVVK